MTDQKTTYEDSVTVATGTDTASKTNNNKKPIPKVCPFLSIMLGNLYPCIEEKCMLHYKTVEKEIHCSLANPFYNLPKDEDGSIWVSINNLGNYLQRKR